MNQRWATHPHEAMSLWSTGLHIQRTSAPGAGTEGPPWKAFSSLRPDLDDEILDFKLSLSGMKLGKLGREGIVYFTCVGIWIVMARRQIVVDCIFLHAAVSPIPFAYCVMLQLFPLRGLCSPPGIRTTYDCFNEKSKAEGMLCDFQG